MGSKPISLNNADAKRRGKSVEVTSANSEHGEAKDHRARFRRYQRGFGADRLRFGMLLECDDLNCVEVSFVTTSAASERGHDLAPQGLAAIRRNKK